LDFLKVREDEQQVDYIFGYPELTRSLAIVKATTQGRPLDGNPDRDYTAVLVKILRLRQAQRIWPERGSYMA
jgi:hypothetical protein